MTENTRNLLAAWLCGHATARDWRNLRRALWLLFAWAITFVGGAQLIRREVISTGPIAWLLAALPLVLAGLALLAYWRFLRETDELNRKVHFEALALGFGGGWFAFAGYRVFELIGAPAMDRGVVVSIMVILYAIGVEFGRMRYR